MMMDTQTEQHLTDLAATLQQLADGLNTLLMEQRRGAEDAGWEDGRCVEADTPSPDELCECGSLDPICECRGEPEPADAEPEAECPQCADWRERYERLEAADTRKLLPELRAMEDELSRARKRIAEFKAQVAAAKREGAREALLELRDELQAAMPTFVADAKHIMKICVMAIDKHLRIWEQPTEADDHAR